MLDEALRQTFPASDPVAIAIEQDTGQDVEVAKALPPEVSVPTTQIKCGQHAHSRTSVQVGDGEINATRGTLQILLP
jgi:hypothetical protein